MSAHETAFGAVDIGPDAVVITATGAQLYDWAASTSSRSYGSHRMA